MALHLEALAAHIGGGAEGGIGVALHGGERAGEIGPGLREQRRAALGRGAVRHRGQRRDVDRDRLRRVLGERRAVRDHHGHRLAHIAHRAGRDHRLLERPEGVELLLPQRNGGDAADVGRGDDGVNAGPRQRRAGIDRDDAAMGDAAAQDHRMQQARPGDVVHIFALAAQEPQILDALDRAADEGVCGAGRVPGAHLIGAHMTTERTSMKTRRQAVPLPARGERSARSCAPGEGGLPRV